MTTNFPSSIDNFTNPTSSSTMASPSHSAQHADVNDAVEAIETALLDGAPLHIDDANERVGIGTTTPSTTLHVAGSILSDDSVTIGSGGEYVAGSIYSDANWGMILRAKQNSPAQAEFRFANSADTERLRIDNSGNVGINDTTPSYKLDVNGDINATGKFYQNGGVYGGVLQIGHDGQYTAIGTTGSTVVSTGLSVTLTPKSSSSQFLIFNSIPCYCGTDSNGYSSVAFYLRRNGSNILTENGFMYDANSSTQHVGKWCHTFLDAPNTTSAVTYELFFSNHQYSNGQAIISVSTGSGYTPSQMWVLELAQ